MSRQIMQMALDVLLNEYSSGAKTNPSPYETIAALEAELAKPANEFHPDWDTLKPYHDRIAELEAQLALDKKADNARELGLDYEPEQEKMCVSCGKPTMHIGDKCYGCCQTAQPEQEPVKKALRLKPHECIFGYSVGHPLVPKCICKPEYTAPPKREWVGLTDEQIRLMAHNDAENDWNNLKFRAIWHSGYLAGFRSAEAKLREKNE